MKIAAVWLVVPVAAAIAACGWAMVQARSISELRQQERELQGQLRDTSWQRLAAAKKECAATAERLFHTLGYKEDTGSSGNKNEWDTLTTHFSRKYGRCLMLTTSISVRDGKEFQNKLLMDANERQQFGEYDWMSSDTKKYWEQRPFTCEAAIPGEDSLTCTSTAEWETYERNMMNS